MSSLKSTKDELQHKCYRWLKNNTFIFIKMTILFKIGQSKLLNNKCNLQTKWKMENGGTLLIHYWVKTLCIIIII